MPFIIIETKNDIHPHKYVILDILSRTYNITKVDELRKRLIIYHEINEIDEENLFFNLAYELYADLRVYISTNEERFSPDIIMEWLEFVPFASTVVYHHLDVLLKRTEYPLDSRIKKIILKTVFEDKDLLHTVKVYLETNQNMSEAAKKLFLHRNTLIQRLDKFLSKTGFDCRRFIDAYIIYALIK